MKNRTAIFRFALMFSLFVPLVINADVIHLAPGDFQPCDPDEGNWQINTGYQEYIYVETCGTNRYLFSRSLDLPHLGTLDQVRIYYYDNSATYSIAVMFMRQKLSDLSEELLAQYTTTGSASFYREEDLESFSFPTIKTKGYRYFFRVSWSSGIGADLRLVGIRIRYYQPSS